MGVRIRRRFCGELVSSHFRLKRARHSFALLNCLRFIGSLTKCVARAYVHRPFQDLERLPCYSEPTLPP